MLSPNKFATLLMVGVVSVVSSSVVFARGGDDEDCGCKQSFFEYITSLDNYYIRPGITAFEPKISSKEIVISGIPSSRIDFTTFEFDFSEFAISDGPIEGSGSTFDGSTFPTVVVGLELPFDDVIPRLSLETILALPIEVEIKNTGTLANSSLAPNGIANAASSQLVSDLANALNISPDVIQSSVDFLAGLTIGGEEIFATGLPPLGEELGETKVLPPVTTLVYKFFDRAIFNPYVGVGFTYLFAYEAKVTNPILLAVRKPEFDLVGSFGLVGQIGFNIDLTDQWFLNADYKRLENVSTKATLKGLAVDVPSEILSLVVPTAEAGNAKTELSLDGTEVFSLAFGYKF